jgi:hypothetical protein
MGDKQKVTVEVSADEAAIIVCDRTLHAESCFSLTIARSVFI